MTRFLTHLLILIFTLTIFSAFGWPQSALAAPTARPEQSDTYRIVPACANNQCTFSDFIQLLKNIYAFIVFGLAVPAATLAIFYAGYLYLVYPTNSGQRSKAKASMMAAVWGLLIALGSYLIISTVVTALVKDGQESNFLRFLSGFE